MRYDFNVLQRSAFAHISANRPQDAIKIYLFMADGDPSLDAGHLGEKLGTCYEMLGDLHAAKYWYGRAVEENPGVRLVSEAARQRLDYLSIDDLVMR